jgi:hypothetical protein
MGNSFRFDGQLVRRLCLEHTLVLSSFKEVKRRC